MKQIFEINWSGGKITPELIIGLLLSYFEKMKYPATAEDFTIKEITNQCILEIFTY